MDCFNLFIMMPEQMCLMKIHNLSCFEKNPSNIFQTTTKVPYGCKGGLDGKISNGQVAIHTKCYDELRKMDDSVKTSETGEMRALTTV